MITSNGVSIIKEIEVEQLLRDLPQDQLLAIKTKYPFYAQQVEAELVRRVGAELKAQGELEKLIAIGEETRKFQDKATKLVKSLGTPPESIINLHYRWAEVTEEVEGAEAEKLPDDVCKANGLELGTMRKPIVKVWKWVVEVNKGFQVPKQAQGEGQPSISKRAVTVYKRDGASNQLVGNFHNYAEACRSLALTCAGSMGGTDSGGRVLTLNGYVFDAYEGEDWTPAPAVGYHRGANGLEVKDS